MLLSGACFLNNFAKLHPPKKIQAYINETNTATNKLLETKKKKLLFVCIWARDKLTYIVGCRPTRRYLALPQKHVVSTQNINGTVGPLEHCFHPELAPAYKSVVLLNLKKRSHFSTFKLL